MEVQWLNQLDYGISARASAEPRATERIKDWQEFHLHFADSNYKCRLRAAWIVHSILSYRLGT